MNRIGGYIRFALNVPNFLQTISICHSQAPCQSRVFTACTRLRWHASRQGYLTTSSHQASDSWDLDLRLIRAKPCGDMWRLPTKHASERFNQSLWCILHFASERLMKRMLLIQFLGVIRWRFILGSFWFRLIKWVHLEKVIVSFVCFLFF